QLRDLLARDRLGEPPSVHDDAAIQPQGEGSAHDQSQAGDRPEPRHDQREVDAGARTGLGADHPPDAARGDERAAQTREPKTQAQPGSRSRVEKIPASVGFEVGHGVVVARRGRESRGIPAASTARHIPCSGSILGFWTSSLPGRWSLDSRAPGCSAQMKVRNPALNLMRWVWPICGSLAIKTFSKV